MNVLYGLSHFSM